MSWIIDSAGYFILDNFVNKLGVFLDKGGDVLWLIAILTLIMWGLALERLWYYNRNLKKDVKTIADIWQEHSDHKSWRAQQIRRGLIARMHQNIDRSLPMIATLVALCPLFGLLGTVTGMIEVFHVMAVTGGGDAKAMAGGVSRATIPTMAGMVAALSGVFVSTIITRIANREKERVAERLLFN